MNFKDIENSIEGYKYVVRFNTYILDDIYGSGYDNLCICDTRDEAIEEIKKDIELNKSYYKENIKSDPYTVDRLGAVVKWHDEKENTSWAWEYSICPVKYKTK